MIINIVGLWPDQKAVACAADPVLVPVSTAGGGKASEAASIEGNTRRSGLVIVHHNMQAPTHSSTGSGAFCVMPNTCCSLC